MESFLLYGNAPHNDKIRRRARSTSENITNSFHDDFVKKNAEFRNDAGMKSYLNRQTDGSCCKWCTKIAGRYDYGKAPEDIFKRHDNCTCTVTFESGRFRQDVWSKKSWEEAPKGVKTKKPTVLSQEQGQAVQNSIMSQYMGIDNSGGSGIIKEKARETAETDVHKLGKIDVEKFKAIANGRILTDEVVITDNRIEHIIERRGQQFYDDFNGYFSEIIENPDYIFKDDKDNTAIVSKSYTHKGKTVNLILRLVVEGENPNYKNSILTAVGENEKRFAQRLRNNVPVYKKVDK